MDNLPLQLSSFIGRSREIEEVQPLLRSCRLLTFTGVGGVGKTRLAFELAARECERYAGGVWWVDLARLADGQLLAQEVGAAMGLHPSPIVPALDVLTGALGGQSALLLLDNCEHLLGDCAAFVEPLLRRCPDVRVLATSREPVRAAGERVWQVPPLALDGSGGRSEALQLFVERVEEAGRLSPAALDGGAAAGICRRLDGIPLAIELAAIKTRTLDLDQLLERLNERFGLLESGARGAPPRQRTLRSMVDWSWDLLDEQERALLRRLGVFAGGWQLEAVEEVCAGGALERSTVLAVLSRLVEKSLVVAGSGPEGVRYRLLETLREYALERLEAAAEAVELRGRHLAWMRALGERSSRDWLGPDARLWLRRMEAELDNARAALAWAQRQPATVVDGLRLAGALSWLYYVDGYLPEGRQALAALLETARAAAGAISEADVVAGLAAAGTLAAISGGVPEAEALLQESLERGLRLPDNPSRARALTFLAVVTRFQNDLETALALATEAVELALPLGDLISFMTAKGVTMEVRLMRGDTAGAVAAVEEAIAVASAHGERYFVGAALTQLANIAMLQGDLPRAQELLDRSLRNAADLGDRGNIVYDLEAAAALAGADGRPRRALRLAGAAQAVRVRFGLPADRQHSERLDATLADIERSCPEADRARSWQEGRDMSLEGAVAYALDWAASDDAAQAPRQESPLTARELEVAACVALGLSNRAIGAELVITEGTAALHVQHILAKLDFHSRAQIAAWVAAGPRT